MKQKIIFVFWVICVCLVGCTGEKKNYESEEVSYSVVSTHNEAIVGYTLNGKDITEEIQDYQNTVKKNILELLNRNEADVKFRYFTMLDDEGCTIDFTLDDETYTVTCDAKGMLQTIVRIETDELYAID